MHALHTKLPQLAVQNHTRHLPGVFLSLGVMLLVAAGLFVTSGGWVSARGAWLRALGPPAWDKRLPAASEEVPGSVPGPEEQAELAAAAVQRPSAPPGVANEMEHGERLLPGPQRSIGLQDEALPDPTHAPRRVVAAPLPPLSPSGRGAVTPLQTRRPPPEQFIRLYYQAINQRQYTQTWAMLSTNFKKTRLCCDPEGNYKFDQYTAWWNTITKVEILDAKTPARDTLPVVVLGTVRYYKKNGSVIDETHRFSLTEDLANKSWLIEAQTRGTSAQHGG
jgi:hypothetical protein